MTSNVAQVTNCDVTISVAEVVHSFRARTRITGRMHYDVTWRLRRLRDVSSSCGVIEWERSNQHIVRRTYVSRRALAPHRAPAPHSIKARLYRSLPSRPARSFPRVHLSACCSSCWPSFVPLTRAAHTSSDSATPVTCVG